MKLFIFIVLFFCLLHEGYGQEKLLAPNLLKFDYQSCVDFISNEDSFGILSLEYTHDTLTATIGMCINCGYQNIQATFIKEPNNSSYSLELLDISDMHVDIDSNGDTISISYNSIVTECSCYKKIDVQFFQLSVEEFMQLRIDGQMVENIHKEGGSCLILEEPLEDDY